MIICRYKHYEVLHILWKMTTLSEMVGAIKCSTIGLASPYVNQPMQSLLMKSSLLRGSQHSMHARVTVTWTCDAQVWAVLRTVGIWLSYELWFISNGETATLGFLLDLHLPRCWGFISSMALTTCSSSLHYSAKCLSGTCTVTGAGA